MARPSATPLAIVAGSALIALAIYFGLRARPPVDGLDAPSAPSAASASAPRAASSQTSVAAQANADAPANADAQANADAALSRLKPELAKDCWQATAGHPERARFLFQSTFDADGQEIARGISDVRGFEASEVGACLRRQPLALRIPPPGGRVRVDVSFDLP